MSLVLLIEDEPALLQSLTRYLTRHEYDVDGAASAAEAEQSFRARRPDVVVTDYDLPDANGLELIARLRAIDPSACIVMLTGHGSIDLAVKAIKEGAEQFLTKPVDLPALLTVLERLTEARRARLAQQELVKHAGRAAPNPFVGTSEVIAQLHEQALRVAESDGPVLIQGETGAGKGVLTRWLHANSPRGAESFVDLNCAGLARELLENELFGHERGAFTGAQSAKPGLLEVAHKGTLFLDEIGDVDLQVQPRLLKVLEEKRFRRLGDVKDRTVDVRLVAATHHDLEKSIAEKRFRSDLYYRISVLPLRIPSLRERREDVPLLARTFMREARLSPSAEKALQEYSWPGNIRELRNVLERAQVLSRKPVLEAADLRLEARPAADVEEPEALTLEEVERRHITRIFQREKGKVARVAEILGMSRSTLYQRLLKYGLTSSES